MHIFTNGVEKKLIHVTIITRTKTKSSKFSKETMYKNKLQPIKILPKIGKSISTKMK